MRATEQKTVDDLITELQRLAIREVFDDIMDADTSDTFDLMRAFKKVYPDLWQEAVNFAIEMAEENGATEERIAISGYEKV